MAHATHRDSGWVICRNFTQIPLPDVDLLPSWAERGRVRPDDYLANSRLEICVLAKEVPELEAIFRRTHRGILKTILGTLGLLS